MKTSSILVASMMLAVKPNSRSTYMLSTQTRLRLEDIAARIAGGIDVSFEEMTFIQKWATHNRHAAKILNQARREVIQGKPEPGSLDEFLNDLDIGDPDPSNHLIGPQDPIDLARRFTKSENWLEDDKND
jgi:hypothetical protein